MELRTRQIAREQTRKERNDIHNLPVSASVREVLAETLV
jgi:hypothetical protein